MKNLRDRAQILDCLNRYAQGVDQRNWPMFLTAFAPEATVIVPGYLAAPVTPEQFRDILRDAFDHNRLSGQHLLGNSAIAIDGDAAHVVTEFLAVTLEDGAQDGYARRQVTAGLYVDDLVRVGDDWLIVRRTLSRKSSDENLIPFLSPVADSVRLTLRSGWPIPTTQETHAQ